MQTSDFIYDKRLGAGTYGAVYRVRSKLDNAVYVIKEQSSDSSFSMVDNEIELLKKMRHPNIVAYHGSWFEDMKGYILMEYAAKGTLKDLLQRRAVPLAEKNALYLFAQVVLGLHHIHKQSVIHRDLKPGNIMLHGIRGDIVKIGDFGVSKDTALQIAKTRVGTRCYMAPEVLQGLKYDSKCDIWSSGIILYELLTNRFPFNLNNDLEMLDQICQGRLRKLPSYSITAETVDLVYKIMRRDPERRPTSSKLVLCKVLIDSMTKVYQNASNDEKSMILGHEVCKK